MNQKKLLKPMRMKSSKKKKKKRRKMDFKSNMSHSAKKNGLNK